MVGGFAKHFDDPLRDSDVPWAGAVGSLVEHVHLMRHNPYRALAMPEPIATSELGEGPELEVPGDIVLRGRVEGARRVEIELRPGVVWHIDVTAGRYEVTGLPEGLEGRVPPLDDPGAWTFQAELHKNRALLGIEGVCVEPRRIEELPVVGAKDIVTIRAQAPGGRCALEVLEKYSETLARHTLDALHDVEALQEYAEIGAMRTPIAAYTLHVFAQLAPSERAREAAARQLRELGELAEPFLGEVPEPQGVAPIERVSFDALITRMEELVPEGVELVTGEDFPDQYEASRYVAHGDPTSYPDTGPDDPTPVASALLLYHAEHVDDDRFEPHWLSGDPVGMITDFSCLPANGGWWQGKASGEVHVDRERDLVLMALSLQGPGYEGWPAWGECLLAFWRCAEGWVFASWGGSREELQQVIGLSTWPTQLEWRSIEGYLGV